MSGHKKWRDLKHKADPKKVEALKREMEAEVDREKVDHVLVDKVLETHQEAYEHLRDK